MLNVACFGTTVQQFKYMDSHIPQILE